LSFSVVQKVARLDITVNNIEGMYTAKRQQQVTHVDTGFFDAHVQYIFLLTSKVQMLKRKTFTAMTDEQSRLLTMNLGQRVV